MQIWKCQYNTSHRIEGGWVLGLAVLINARKILYIPSENIRKRTLIKSTRKYMKKRSIIYKNCWRGYLGIHKYFVHKMVNHSTFFKTQPLRSTPTPMKETGLLKKRVPVRWTTSDKMYLPLEFLTIKKNYKRVFLLNTFIECKWMYFIGLFFILFFIFYWFCPFG